MLSNCFRFSKGHILYCGELSQFYKPVNFQCIRWRRKPRWLPTAPSKLFKVPERKKYPPEEELEVRTLYNHYRTEMKSLRSYFCNKIQTSLTGEDISEEKKKQEEEHQRCFQLNEEWNKKIAILREERRAIEKDKELEQIVRVIQENKVNAKERKEQLEALVRKEKELSKFYITPENIDAAIEKALSSEVDYNFSIDLSGNIFRGRDTKPVPPENAVTNTTEEVAV